MKRLLAASAVVALGLSLATPALAGHSGHSRGQGRVVVRGVHRPAPRVVYRSHAYVRPRIRSSFFLGIGLPFYAPVYAPAYAPTPYYGPAPAAVVVVPGPCDAFVAAHWAIRGGTRVWVQGYWTHRADRGRHYESGDYDDYDGD
jgi:hypothetical protein